MAADQFALTAPGVAEGLRYMLRPRWRRLHSRSRGRGRRQLHASTAASCALRHGFAGAQQRCIGGSAGSQGPRQAWRPGQGPLSLWLSARTPSCSNAHARCLGDFLPAGVPHLTSALLALPQARIFRAACHRSRTPLTTPAHPTLAPAPMGAHDPLCRQHHHQSPPRRMPGISTSGRDRTAVSGRTAPWGKGRVEPRRPSPR